MTDRSDNVLKLTGKQKSSNSSAIGSEEWMEKFQAQARELTDFEWHQVAEAPGVARVAGLDSLRSETKAVITAPKTEPELCDNVTKFPGTKADS